MVSMTPTTPTAPLWQELSLENSNLNNYRHFQQIAQEPAGNQSVGKLPTHQKIVFTNGCFDLLHPGHLAYLAEAKALGGFLAVGINSDQSIRALKGELRPVNNQWVRQTMLLGLKAVDAVFIFNEPTPLELIQFLKPHVLVKGGDWSVEKIVGAKEVLSWGGEVKNLSFIDGFSTTNLIDNIKKYH